MPHDIVDKFSTHLKNVLTRALVFVVENRRALVEPEHLLWALGTEKGSVGAEILQKSEVRQESLRALAASLPRERAGDAPRSSSSPFLSEAAKRAVEKAVLTATTYEHRYVGTEHLLAGLVQVAHPGLESFFARERANMPVLREELASVLRSTTKFPEFAESIPLTESPAGETAPEARPEPEETKTPALDFFGRDLTSKAIQATIDPVIGREDEVARVIEILARRTKNNPLLLGEPGVGKTAVVEGLAKRILEGDVPPFLADKRVVALDLGLVVAGTMYRGEFEGRLKQIVEEVKKCGNVILFVDEMHQIVGAGSAGGSMDAANMLKPALARGEIRMIGATTPAEYKKHVETDSALERRFQTVRVDEPTPERAREILRGVAPKYEAFHRVRLSPEAIDAAVSLSVRYFPDRRLPDKALDLVDEASAAARVRRPATDGEEARRSMARRLAEVQSEKRQAVLEERFPRAAELKEEEARLREAMAAAERGGEPARAATDVGEKDVARVVARATGIPLEDILSGGPRDLSAIRSHLSARVIGQDEAVGAVSAALRRAKVGLAPANRPLASMMLLGPSGVGKTELARAIAEAFFQDPSALIRLDMSEYAEGFTSSKLLGAPAGYVGYREGATLSDRVKARPYSVVLFDELEKAHRDVQNLLLQILEEGELTDATGRRVSFRHAVVVLTSNVGLERFESGGIGFVSGEAERQGSVASDVRKELEARFRPELLNRLDLTSLFRPLSKEALARIAQKQLDELAARLAERGVRLTAQAAVAERIAAEAEAKHGARDIRRHIQTRVEDRVADLLAAGTASPIQIRVTNGVIDVTYARGRNTAKR